MSKIFSNVHNERLYEKIVVQIRELIRSGQLQPGNKLPGERNLAVTLGCSRTSLREAFRVLESQGLIISKSGGGRFVQHLLPNIDYVRKNNAVDLLEKSAVLYFLEAREVLEPRIAALAVDRATEAQIARMEAILLSMSEQLKNPGAKVNTDSSFHLALAEATQNFVFVSMMESNLSMIRQVRKQTLSDTYHLRTALDEHQAILDGIKQRDPEAAVQATLRHLQSLKRNVTKMDAETAPSP